LDSDAEAEADPNTLAVEVYNPPPSKEYVCCIEKTLLRTRGALVTAF